MKNILILFGTILLVSCNSSSNKKQTALTGEDTQYKLDLIWESDTTLRTPESVLLDHKRNILYVSNVNENPWEQDGNGFISKMDRNGKIIDLKWIEGLNGPKGMGINGQSLFVADINLLVEIDIETGQIKSSAKLEGSPDLNDITVADDGTVYVSGSGSNSIYKLENEKLVPVFTGNEGERFNGLFWEKDRMLLLTSNSSIYYEIPWETMEAKVIGENMGHGDGIAPVGNGAYLATNWAGEISHVSSDGEITRLLDTRGIEENAADIDFCMQEQILYVPTFFKNQVKAYKLLK